jgi:hypothetical protein
MGELKCYPRLTEHTPPNDLALFLDLALEFEGMRLSARSMQSLRVAAECSMSEAIRKLAGGNDALLQAATLCAPTSSKRDADARQMALTGSLRFGKVGKATLGRKR